jgi:DNA-binding transcriptional MerR regulator/methylmalonyl-CoA mutase cobalamin-binding subunit
MKLYSIGELAILSQIKAHTIRVWEQRYGLLTPSRSEGNTRYYSEDQLMKLLKVALLNKNGIKISVIAELSNKELDEKTEEVATNDQSLDAAVEQLMVASINFNQKKIAELFNSYNKRYGVEDTFEKIVFPFLRVVGNLWVNGKITPGHEHFFTNMCRLKLFSEIDALPPSDKNKPGVLLCMPEWDFHELGILYYHYIFSKAGYPCTYLGQAVPADDVIYTTKATNSEIIIINFIGPTTQKDVSEYLEKISTNLPDKEILVSGPHVNFPIKNKKITVYYNINMLIERFNLK